MVATMAEGPLVSMFRCTQCSVRLFEKDCAGHLARHGLAVPADTVLTYFERGEPIVAGRPGDSAGVTPVYFAPHNRKGAKKRVVVLEPTVPSGVIDPDAVDDVVVEDLEEVF
jgi:hypothetical protein